MVKDFYKQQQKNIYRFRVLLDTQPTRIKLKYENILKKMKKNESSLKMIQDKLSQVEQRWKMVAKEARQEVEQKTLPSFTPFQTSYVYQEEQI